VSHRRMAWVAEAIVGVLERSQEPMQAKAIHVEVEASLAAPVSWSSVKNALADGMSGRRPRFRRIAVGRYELVDAADRQSRPA
jgi:hypothetical protein